MANLNHVVLIGRLTRDMEVKYTNGGLAVGNLSLANNYRKRSGDQWTEAANFFDISIFGKTAENLRQYLVKGKEIAVEGELRQNRWEQDGQQRSRVVVIGQNIQLLGGANHQSGETSRADPDRDSSTGEPKQGEFDDGFEDDIPF